MKKLSVSVVSRQREKSGRPFQHLQSVSIGCRSSAGEQENHSLKSHSTSDATMNASSPTKNRQLRTDNFPSVSHQLGAAFGLERFEFLLLVGIQIF
jgi:hypothetical protein